MAKEKKKKTFFSYIFSISMLIMLYPFVGSPSPPPTGVVGERE